MIKNLIFDMGGVLIEWDPALFLRRMGLVEQEDIDKIIEVVIKQGYWHECDFGRLSIKEVEKKTLVNLDKRLKKYGKEFIYHWPNYAKEIEGMKDFLFSLKAKGYNLYLLSNAQKNQPFYFKKYGYEMFDGKIVSAFYKTGKPDKSIFDLLIKKYNLNKEETLFIDDTLTNVEASNRYGIRAIHFKDLKSLKKELKELDA